MVETGATATRQPSPRLHFLRLAQLLFEKLALADVLGHHQADSPSSVCQFVRDAFDLNHLAVFLAMLAMTMLETFVRDLFHLIKISCPFLLRAKVENAHFFKFIQ